MKHGSLIALATAFALMHFASSPAHARDGAPMRFNPDTDSLCFRNFEPDLADTIPILGPWGARTGVCQGMAGITAAFLEHADFNPSAEAPSKSEAQALVDRALKLHRGDCDARVKIPGYRNLHEFCAAHRELFLRQAVAYNANIGLREIAPNFIEFEIRRNHPIVDRAGLKRLDQELRKVLDHLEQGRNPLLLRFSHVVMVFAASWEVDNQARQVLKLLIEDSNVWGIRELKVIYSRDGLPASGQNRMFWDVTPARATVVCRKRDS